MFGKKGFWIPIAVHIGNLAIFVSYLQQNGYGEKSLLAESCQIYGSSAGFGLFVDRSDGGYRNGSYGS